MREEEEVMKKLIVPLPVHGTILARQEDGPPRGGPSGGGPPGAVLQAIALNMHSPRARPQTHDGEEGSEAKSGTSGKNRIDAP